MSPPDPGVSKPLLQRIMDNHWVLLVLGLVVPFVSYTAWGWWDLTQLPPATLP